MPYKVTKQYARGGETQAATFKNINEAKSFIQEKLADDARLKVKIIYRLYAQMQLIQEFNPDELEIPADSSGSQGQGKQQSFRPTPLNMAPRPGGMPPNWWKDEEDDKKDK